MLKTNNFVATLIAHPQNPVLTAEIAIRVREFLSAKSITWLAPEIACDITFQSLQKPSIIEEGLRNLLNGCQLDIIVQKPINRRKKLLVADMDSTIIEQECIDELAESAGIKDRISSITESAMRGELAFEPALRQRVHLLKNLSISVIDEVLQSRITIRSGAKTLVKTMRNHGAYTALISGGFTLFTQKIADLVGFDEHQANRLMEENGRLTGEVRDPILGKEAKLTKMLELCQKLRLNPDETLAVGDGANDLAMLTHAGCGVAFHAKPIVADAAAVKINYADLTGLLYIQGFNQKEFS